jgi:tetratricopeptide (TPR) repeat protein
VTALSSAVLLAAFSPSMLQDGESPGDEILLRELRARGLNQLFDAYSRRRLGDEKLDPAAREAAAVELATTTSRNASMENSTEARRSGWAESDALMEPWLRAEEGVEPANFEFRLQHANMIRERGETAVELLKAVPSNKELAEDALSQAQKAAGLLSKLHLDVRRRDNQLAGGDPKKSTQIKILDNRVSFHAALAWLAVVTAAPPGDVKTKAAQEADQRLKFFANRFERDPQTMEAFLARGRLYKETERFDEAMQVVGTFELHPLAPPFTQRATLLAAQILLAQNKPSEALARLDVPENKRLGNSGEWSLTLFEAMLRGSRRDITAPPTRRKEAIDLLASLEKKFGGYWKTRGQQVLAKYGDEEIVGDDPSLLALVATLRRDGKEYDAATSMFDRAARLERAANQPERAARMSLSAANTVSEKGDAAGAAKRYLELAKELDQAPLAADALLGAAGALHKTALAGDAKSRTDYRNSLDRLLALPSADAALKHEAAWLRGRLAETEKQPQQAIERYREIPTGHQRAGAALAALAALHHDHLLGAPGKSAGDQAIAAAIEDLETRLKALPAGAKERAIGSWVLARLLAEHRPDRLAEAAKLVESAVVAEPNFPVAENRVWQTLLGWQIRLGDIEGVKATVARGFPNDPKGLAESLLRMSAIEEGAPQKEAATRAEAAQHAVDLWLAKSDQLPERTRAGLKLLSAQALAARRDYAAAVRVLRQVREESPRDPRAPKVLGRVLFLAGEFRESLAEWNALIGGLPRGQEEWLNAVAEAVRCQLELGERGLASELLKTIDTAYKGKGSEGVRRRFDELRKQAER